MFGKEHLHCSTQCKKCGMYSEDSKCGISKLFVMIEKEIKKE